MTDEIGEQLAGWGTVLIVATRGHVTGRGARAAIGYVADVDGSLLVAAGRAEAAWARNLQADPACLVTIGDEVAPYVAEELAGDDRNAAIARLILRYGTPAEGLGRGPAFRLRRVVTD
jgi:deazaflavin-dependent oxidoreductase (nitroreductase family)